MYSMYRLISDSMYIKMARDTVVYADAILFRARSLQPPLTRPPPTSAQFNTLTPEGP